MNSFKKISIAIAAALAFVGISVAPSSAAPLAVTVASVNNTTTYAAPATVAVPSANQITSGTSLSIVATADTGTTVSFTASSTIKLVTALNTTSPATVTTASGTSSYTATSAGTAITVYAYTTSATVGSVTVVNGAYSTIVYIQGTAGPAYNVALSVPSATAVGTVPTITALATDVFGNPVASEPIMVTLVGTTFADSSITKTLTTSAVTSAVGVTPVTVFGSKTEALATAVTGEVTVVATGANSATAVTGLAAPVKSAISKFTVSDLAGQIALLKAELASEKSGRATDKVAADKALSDANIASDKAIADAKATSVTIQAAADLAKATYIAEYNALAKKWNAKNPKAKVSLKK